MPKSGRWVGTQSPTTASIFITFCNKQLPHISKKSIAKDVLVSKLLVGPGSPPWYGKLRELLSSSFQGPSSSSWLSETDRTWTLFRLHACPLLLLAPLTSLAVLLPRIHCPLLWLRGPFLQPRDFISRLLLLLDWPLSVFTAESSVSESLSDKLIT